MSVSTTDWSGFAKDPWVRIALARPRWTPEQIAAAQELRPASLHLGEVAEAMGCSVFEAQAELEIGPPKEVKWYRHLRGLPVLEKTRAAIGKAAAC